MSHEIVPNVPFSRKMRTQCLTGCLAYFLPLELVVKPVFFVESLDINAEEDECVDDADVTVISAGDCWVAAMSGIMLQDSGASHAAEGSEMDSLPLILVLIELESKALPAKGVKLEKELEVECDFLGPSTIPAMCSRSVSNVYMSEIIAGFLLLLLLLTRLMLLLLMLA